MLTSQPVRRLALRRRAGSTLILAYHNIVPHGERVAGDSSLHLPQQMFAQQLDALLETHDVISLAAVLRPVAEAARPRAVITFDDATVGALTAGVAELRSRGLPATVFVAPHFVNGRSFWWDALTERDGRSMGEDLRRFALTSLRGSDDVIRDWAASRGLPLRQPPLHQLCANESELQAVAGLDITYGSHTWSHPNLTAIGDADLERELAHPLQWLTERFGNVVKWLAYPYGLCNARVAGAAAAAGYTGALRVEGGWVTGRHTDAAHRHLLPRYNIPAGLTIRGFRLRTSGLLE